MKCRYCGDELHEGWSFCPFCGAPSGTELNLSYSPKDIEKEIQKLHRILQATLGQELRGGVSIKISNVDGKPDIQVKKFGDLDETQPIQELDSPQKVRRVPRETSEPESIVQKVENAYILKIKMPDVAEEDVDVLKCENSVEIRGYVGDKVYFKVLEIPVNGNVVYKKLENGVLTVKVAV